MFLTFMFLGLPIFLGPQVALFFVGIGIECVDRAYDGFFVPTTGMTVFRRLSLGTWGGHFDRRPEIGIRLVFGLLS